MLRKKIGSFKFKWLLEFFEDSRNNFSIFTIVSLCSGIALVYSCIIEVNQKGTVQTEIIYALFFMYCVSVVGDQLLSMIIERGVWKISPPSNSEILADVSEENLTVTPTNTETQVSDENTKNETSIESVPLPEPSKSE